MLLTLTTTHPPATDLGYVLAKHPARCQTFPLSFGSAHVFFPEAGPDRCTAALLLDLDPVDLVRGRRGTPVEGVTLGQYVNDRPYVASSFLSVAIARVLGTAMSGQSRERPDLAAAAIPLTAEIAVVRCVGGMALLTALFAPLGYDVEAERLPLDARFPAWGDSPYVRLTLSATCRVRDILRHLYVLLPVLDDDKHYWVGADETDKLLAMGDGWLADHPARELIVGRYLKHQRGLADDAVARLVAADGSTEREGDGVAGMGINLGVDQRADGAGVDADIDTAPLRPPRLADLRLAAVVDALHSVGARRVVDLGCGEGRLLEALLRDAAIEHVAGMDVAHRALERAAARLRLDDMAPAQRARVSLFQGALTYRDARLAGYDAACAVEVIEHLDPERLPAFERVVFGAARPGVAIITTPNAEYNTRYPTLADGVFRHADHRFEWSRAEFRAWGDAVAGAHGYTVRYVPVGDDDPAVGPPTQMAVFERCA